MAVVREMWRAAARRGTRALPSVTTARRTYSGPAAPSAEEVPARPFAEMPGPKPLPVVGNVWRFLPVVGPWSGKDFLEICWDLYKEYGKIVKLEKMNEGRDAVFVYDPNDVEKLYRNEGPTPVRKSFESLDYYRRNMTKDKYEGAYGLLPTNGKEWQDFRRRVQPHMLQPRAVAKYTAPIDSVSSDFIQRLREIRDSSSMLPEDSMDWFFRWAFESISVIALDARMGCMEKHLAPNSEQQRLIEAVHVLMGSFYELDVKPSAWRYISTPTWRRFVKAVVTFESITQRYIEKAMNLMKEKVASGQELGDDLSVLERLLLSNDNPRIANTMAMDMIFAGIDTTSHSTIMLMYLLSKNPEKQEILYEELQRIFPERDTPVTNERLQETKYLRACIKEAMRLKPVVIGQVRDNVKDGLVLGNYNVPKGVDIIMVTSVSSYLAEYVPEPDRFLPERWLRNDDQKSKGHPFATLPFGFGPRVCIGKRFAELELEILSAKIFRNFQVEYPREAKFQTDFVHKMTSPSTFVLKDRK